MTGTIGMLGLLLQPEPAYLIGGGVAPSGKAILTEAGANLTTESGSNLNTET